MKRFAIAIPVAAALALVASAAQAKPSRNGQNATAVPKYSWCLLYRSGTQNCYFTSKAQCEASASGNGGFCRMI
jgi:hypothetical protein